MGTRDPRIDAYIEKAAEFAQPILARLRELVHATCPEVEETVKWGSPSFEYHGLLCGMAAFQKHCTFGFWKHELVVGENGAWRDAMGSFGRITKLSDLPSKAEIARYMKKAMQLNEQGVRAPQRKTAPKARIAMHPALKAALARNKKARSTFESFPPSAKRDYLEWVAGAKAEDTRARRIEQAVGWMAEGKRRNWKYERC